MGHQDDLFLWIRAMAPHHRAALSVYISIYRWFQVLEFTGLGGLWCPLCHRMAGLVQRDPPADTSFGRGWRGWTGMKSRTLSIPVHHRSSPAKNGSELSPPPAHFRVFCVRFFQGCNPADPMVGLARDSPVKRDEPFSWCLGVLVPWWWSVLCPERPSRPQLDSSLSRVSPASWMRAGGVFSGGMR